MRRESTWMAVAVAVALAGCDAGSDGEQAARPGGPLKLHAAQAALCGGGASRESNGRGPRGGADDGYSGGAASADAGVSGAGGGAGGGYWGGEGGGTGGAGDDGWDDQADVGVPRDAGPPPVPCDGGGCAIDANVPPPPDCDGGVCPVDADVPPPPPTDGGPTTDACVPDADGGGCPVDGGVVSPTATDESALCEGIDLETPRTLYMSADDSNSMASPAITRMLIRNGAQALDPWMVRTYEFLNYYRFGFDAAPAGELAVTAQLGSCDLTGDLALQVAVTSEAAASARPPMNLVLVLDTSGSMSGEPIDRERAAIRALAATLMPGDTVSAVTWNTEQRPVLEGVEVDGADDPRVLALADRIDADGGTDLSNGLRVGYELARTHYREGGLNRVVLISDGQANVGVTDEEIIGGGAEDQDAEGIYLVGVGVGDGVNDTLMDTVTDLGRGAYVYLDSEAEAERMFIDRFGETMLVAARGVRIAVTLPPYFNVQKFYGETYSPDPAKVRPQHLAPDDSMVLYQILRPCDPSLPRAEDPIQVRATWSDRETGEPREVVYDRALGDLGIDDGRLKKAATVIEYAEAVKQLIDLDAAGRIKLLEATLRSLRAATPEAGDADLAELVSLTEQLIENNRNPPSDPWTEEEEWY